MRAGAGLVRRQITTAANKRAQMRPNDQPHGPLIILRGQPAFCYSNSSRRILAPAGHFEGRDADAAEEKLSPGRIERSARHRCEPGDLLRLGRRERRTQLPPVPSQLGDKLAELQHNLWRHS